LPSTIFPAAFRGNFTPFSKKSARLLTQLQQAVNGETMTYNIAHIKPIGSATIRRIINQMIAQINLQIASPTPIKNEVKNNQQQWGKSTGEKRLKLWKSTIKHSSYLTVFE
jgi:hypothetical protein